MSGGQPQFRYTQPPSKVLHIRNLPWECAAEELVELCKPFGKVLNTKLNVGANHNQAFVEFENVNQAINMVSFYASSSEPAQIRGKAVYLQYSTRQEIVASRQVGDVSSNVLLVTIEGVEAGDISIDVLHLVFSAFGFVHKIATFEKSAGFQALVQFGDSNTAMSAKSSLEGRSIPRYLLPEHVSSCNLKISFSAHSDLNVKFQSHRSRDYTNPYLPVAPSATDAASQRREPESNVLLVSMENMQYAVTLDILHTVFSAYGAVHKLAIFEKQAGFQALVQYADVATASQAKDALEGHCIYDGGFCKLRLSFSRHTDLNVKANNDRSRDYTNPNLPHTAPASDINPLHPSLSPTAMAPAVPAPAAPLHAHMYATQQVPSGPPPPPPHGHPHGGPSHMASPQQQQQQQQHYMAAPPSGYSGLPPPPPLPPHVTPAYYGGLPPYSQGSAGLQQHHHGIGLPEVRETVPSAVAEYGKEVLPSSHPPLAPPDAHGEHNEPPDESTPAPTSHSDSVQAPATDKGGAATHAVESAAAPAPAPAPAPATDIPAEAQAKAEAEADADAHPPKEEQSSGHTDGSKEESSRSVPGSTEIKSEEAKEGDEEKP